MEEIGVIAAVKELQSFISDMGKIDSTITSLVPTSSLLGGAFDWLGNVMSNLAQGAVRILEYTLGGLLKDAIEKVTQSISDLIKNTIEAGNEFQVLTILLNGINFEGPVDSTRSYSEAMDEAISKTREQLDWIQALSVATPFNSTDVAQVYTLARGYGFSDEEARKLTITITNFSAAMGLESDSIVRIIQNLGQMDQRGKITGDAIRNLTRSAFLPLDDVLQRVADKMGLSKEALEDLMHTAEGVPSDVFIAAFEEMVAEEPRFVGAVGRMGRSFGAAVSNAKDLVSNIGGMSIVTPVLDVLGEHVASLVDQFVMFNEQGDLIKTDKWTELQLAAKGVGAELSSLVNDIINLFIPNTEGLADGMINSLSGVSDWLFIHHDDIMAWAQAGADWITNTLIPAVESLITVFLGVPATLDLGENPNGQLHGNPNNPQEVDGSGAAGQVGLLAKAYEQLSNAASDAYHWVAEVLWPFMQNNVAPVIGVLLPLFSALGSVIKAALWMEPDESLTDWINGTLVPAIQDLTKWVIENKATLATWMRLFIIGAVVMSVLSAAISIVIAVVSEMVVALLGMAVIGGTIIGTFIAETAVAFVTWAYGNLTAITTFIVNSTAAFVQWAFGNLTAIWSFITGSVTAFQQWAASNDETILSWISGTVEKITAWGVSVATVFSNALSIAFTIVAAWKDNTLAFIFSWASSAFGSISGALTNIKDTSSTNWEEIKNTVKTTLDDILGKVKDKFQQMYDDVDTKMREIAKNLFIRAQGWIQQIIEGTKGMAAGVIAQLNAIIAEIQAGIMDIIIDVIFKVAPFPAVPGQGGGGNGGGSCFVAGTKVTMSDWTERNIEDIQVGDSIISWDVREWCPIVSVVEEVFHHAAESVSTYILLNGIGVTNEHLMFSGGWVPAGSLKVGDELVGKNGKKVSVNTITHIRKHVETFNIHTDHESHNYFANGVLAHNSKAQNVTPGYSSQGTQVTATDQSSQSVSISNQYNLTISSSAPTEPIVADFDMMRSFQGE